jgi:cysteine desulfuration protein SufE
MEELFAEKIEACPPALQEIIDEFREVEPRDRLELLLEYSRELPPLPERLEAARDAMEQVHECQSPVFLHTELDEGAGGPQARFYFDIPAEAPTIRGYASVLLGGLDHAAPEQVLAVPEDVYMLLGLHEAITPQRLRGLHALVVYMKRQLRALQA